MSGRTKRAAATRAEGAFTEREEFEVWQGGEEWQGDWESEAAPEEPLAAAAAAADASPPAKRRKARALETESAEVRDTAETGDIDITPPAMMKVQTAAEAQAELERWMGANRNQNTTAAYASAWRQFERWATEVANPQRATAAQVDLQRPSGMDVALYMRYVVTVKGSTMQSVESALAGIADHLRHTDHHPTSSSWVRQMRQVLVPMAKPAGQKKEMGWELMKKIMTATKADGEMLARRDGAMILLAYFGLLRGSEIARMKRGDITITEQGQGKPRRLNVHVNRMAKNDKERKGHTRLVEERPPGQFCALRAVEEHMTQQREQDNEAPLFPTTAGKAMHADTPRGRMRYWLGQAGLTSVAEYGFHSLRAGGATAAALAGVPVENIKGHGNWNSEAVYGYIRPDDEARLRASRAMGGE